ncbi:MAG: flagellar export chaperone FliS, partial [Candidatus Acidiferrales bacterium]
MRDAARAYRESAVRGASPVGLIVILYEEVIRSMRKAQRALASGNIEERTHSLSHAIAVVGHLQGVLDFTKGGQVASDLAVFYDLTRGKMLEANVRADDQIMETVATEFAKIKEAWHAVDREVTGQPAEPHEAREELVPALASASARRES